MPFIRAGYCAAILALICTVLLIRLQKRKFRAPYPPSRPRLPFFGNFFEIPKQTPWKTYHTWSRELNCDLLSIWAFGQLSIIVNSERVAHDLFERNSAIYSEKPQTTMLTLMGWDFFTGFKPYAEKWRTQRRAFHQHFREAVVPEYEPVQYASAERLVKRLYNLSGDITGAVQTNVATLVMDIAYGFEVAPKNDPIVRVMEEAAGMISDAIFPGAMAVDAIPALLRLPEWLPGTYFKTYGRKCRHLIDEMLQAPLTIVQRSMAEGIAKPSVVRSMLQENEATEGGSDGLALAKEVGGSIYTAGTHTTTISLNVAIHALFLHADVQRRAQNELDIVVGRDRLPSFADRQDLRYVNAICREVLRWKLVAPLGLPRTTRQDDVYEGLFIPKGTILLPNAWAMLHDPEKYPDPEAFKPERFLDKNGELNDDDVSAAFGFGRRICPGRHLVLSTLFINIACMLSVFNILHKKDENGDDVPVNVVYADGLTSTPSPWECAFTPRDEQATRLLETLMQDGRQPESK